MNIVIKNQWRNWTHRTALDDLSGTGILDSKRFATIHLQTPTVAGYTWKEHNHADKHVSMTCDPFERKEWQIYTFETPRRRRDVHLRSKMPKVRVRSAERNNHNGALTEF